MEEFNKSLATERIEYLVKLLNNSFPKDGSYNRGNFDEAMYGIHSLIVILYGSSSEHLKMYNGFKDFYIKASLDKQAAFRLQTSLIGLLKSIQFELDNGILKSLESQTRGEIFGDFISLAKELIDNNHKESSVVLACGALEECISKFVQMNNLELSQNGLTENINLLKSKGLLKGTQSGVIQSYVKIRNKAFHADFDKIEIPEIYSLIAFVEQFVIKYFK